MAREAKMRFNLKFVFAPLSSASWSVGQTRDAARENRLEEVVEVARENTTQNGKKPISISDLILH